MKIRVLVVEDNKDMLELLRQELEFFNYEVIVAKNGIEAVELATTEFPDLIIMDIAMPEMDGLQAASKIKNSRKTKATPILAATASAMVADRERCLQSGCDAYIAKPFTYKQLEAAMKALLKEPSNGKPKTSRGGV